MENIQRENEALKKMLSSEQPFIFEGIERTSMIIRLLTGARHLSGYDINGGEFSITILEKYIDDGIYESIIFSGLLNYLIFLEQIGSIVRPKNLELSVLNKPKNIEGALYYFSELDDDSRIAIIQLRNCLAHRFGLATENKSKKKNKSNKVEDSYKFVLEWFKLNTKIVDNSKQKWQGDFSDKSEETSTTIYVKNLIQLIEDIYNKIKELADSNQIELILTDGIEELFTRYAVK